MNDFLQRSHSIHSISIPTCIMLHNVSWEIPLSPDELTSGVKIKLYKKSISAARLAPLLPQLNALQIFFSKKLGHKTQMCPGKQAQRWMIPKAFGNTFNIDWMDSGAVTPVITAGATGGKAHLTK